MAFRDYVNIVLVFDGIGRGLSDSLLSISYKAKGVKEVSSNTPLISAQPSEPKVTVIKVKRGLVALCSQTLCVFLHYFCFFIPGSSFSQFF